MVQAAATKWCRPAKPASDKAGPARFSCSRKGSLAGTPLSTRFSDALGRGESPRVNASIEWPRA